MSDSNDDIPPIRGYDHSEKDPLKRVQKFWDQLSVASQDVYGAEFFKICHPVEAFYSPNGKQATVIFSVDPLPKAVCNGMNNLHGGAAATMFDILTTVAIAPLSKPGKFRFGGVSRTLACGYARAMPRGQRGRVVCETANVGGRLSLLQGKLYDEEGNLCVTCEHHKASVDPPEKL